MTKLDFILDEPKPIIKKETHPADSNTIPISVPTSPLSAAHTNTISGLNSNHPSYDNIFQEIRRRINYILYYSSNVGLNTQGMQDMIRALRHELIRFLHERQIEDYSIEHYDVEIIDVTYDMSVNFRTTITDHHGMRHQDNIRVSKDTMATLYA